MYKNIKEECYEANCRLPELGLTIYTFGNVSCFDPAEKVFAIKPSGVDYQHLTPADMVVVDLNCRVIEGRLRPSSDTDTHATLYRAFPDLRSITHTHSCYATSWAQSLLPVPVYGTTHADHLPCAIPCTELMADDRIKNNYETETALQIIECFKKQNLDYHEVPMVLVGGHGPFTWGENAAKALYHARILEELCKMAVFTRMINPETPTLKTSLIDKHYQRKHGKNAYYGQK